MSDAPQGPGWWQASDDKWYPPESHPDVTDASGRWSDPGAIPDPGPLGDGSPPPASPPGAAPWGRSPGQPYGAGPGQPYGPGPGQPYGVQPGSYGMPYGATPTNEPLAITSMVLGIASLPLICCCYIGIGTGIAAVVTGIMARRKIAESNGMLEGEGMALAGLIVGGIALVLTIGLLVANVAFSWNDWGANY